MTLEEALVRIKAFCDEMKAHGFATQVQSNSKTGVVVHSGCNTIESLGMLEYAKHLSLGGITTHWSITAALDAIEKNPTIKDRFNRVFGNFCDHGPS